MTEQACRSATLQQLYNGQWCPDSSPGPDWISDGPDPDLTRSCHVRLNGQRSTNNHAHHKWDVSAIKILFMEHASRLARTVIGVGQQATVGPVTPHSVFRPPSCCSTSSHSYIMATSFDKEYGRLQLVEIMQYHLGWLNFNRACDNIDIDLLAENHDSPYHCT